MMMPEIVTDAGTHLLLNGLRDERRMTSFKQDVLEFDVS